MNQDKFLMDNQCVLVSASRYLSVVYDIDLVTDDDRAAWKLRSYVKLLNDDDVLAEYWEMYKQTYQQEFTSLPATSSTPSPIVDDFSLWDNDMSHASDTNTDRVETLDDQNIIDFMDETRIVLPRGI